MAKEQDKSRTFPENAPDERRKEPGVLPEGIRGTTRDIGETVPKDEHAGHPDRSGTMSETDRATAAGKARDTRRS